MRSVQYGSQKINYIILENDELKSHYITVDKISGVTLKGKALSALKADRLVLKKAKWILQKLRVVGTIEAEEKIVTGSRLPYLGKNYYVQVKIDRDTQGVYIEFNHSKFIISLPSTRTSQEDIKKQVESFYRDKAIEKITPRVIRHASKTNHPLRTLRYKKNNKSRPR